ncbi:MAG: hypothetical protein ABGY41_03340, partial [Candidatus Poribacteria bacterium]
MAAQPLIARPIPPPWPSTGTAAAGCRILIGTRTAAPFDFDFLVPPTLRNGNPFNILVEIETERGEVIRERARRVELQGENLPTNPFTVTLQISEEYFPNPLEMRAFVQNSSEPVAQVEFYYRRPNGTDFERIGKNVGPDYFLTRDFLQAESGGQLFARAIDVFGNITESTPQAFQRLVDTKPPEAQIKATGQKIGEQFAGGHAIEITAKAQDGDSGVDRALLYRQETNDGVAGSEALVAALFENGSVGFTEAAPTAGAELTYRLHVRDRVLSPNTNEAQATQTYIIVADNFPEFGTPQVPATIREGARFEVVLPTTDDLDLEQVRVTYRGSSQRVRFAGTTTEASPRFTLRDVRSERVGPTGAMETLAVEAIDSLGQRATAQHTIAVQPDAAPNPSVLGVVLDASGFFGSPLRLELSGVNNVDDGPASELSFEVFDNTLGATRRVVARRN